MVCNNRFTLLLYADDAVIMSEQLLNNLHEYSIKWKLTVNTEKNTVMVFRKGGNLPKNILFSYNDNEFIILNSFVYLGMTFICT